MTKTAKLIFFLSWFIILPSAIHAEMTPSAQQTPPVIKPLPIVYPMKYIYIVEDDKTEVILSVGNDGFKTVAALKRFIEKLPEGTTLDFNVPCKQLGNEILFYPENQLEDFKKFCADHKIVLMIHLGG